MIKQNNQGGLTKTCMFEENPFYKQFSNANVNSQTISDYLCVCFSYLKKYMDKLVAVYKDDQEIKAGLQEANDYYINSFIRLLEKESGPAAEHCELPEASSNPSQSKSFVPPLIEAIQNIQNIKKLKNILK